jgi:hypothetical protein
MTWKGWDNFVPGPDKAPAQGHKYHARQTVVDGIRFASRREAHRYIALKQKLERGEIRHLQRQVRFGLHPLMRPPVAEVGGYVADFVYEEVVNDRVVVHVEDVKGYRLPFYRWKKRHFELEYGIPIEEV